ncbi:S8/S53 family peptidase [Algoriphagus lutimaris]|uniref:S8 family peptidase n=1 Tax=Algoriphagus lutimaris TaxID=613197 RepID=UPI00196A229B|nr:S8/S53 family peptidase [Algoriphagus lutimaris]MBN3519536.1 S8/S53 family peptidase [Algoriphagus lutimaris]
MKRYLILLVFGFAFFLTSCNRQKTSDSNGEQIASNTSKEEINYELIFKEESLLTPLMNSPGCSLGLTSEECLPLIKELKDRVIEIIKSIDSSINVDENQIRLYSEVSVYLDDLTASELINLEREKGTYHYELVQSIGVQARRPIMQSEYILQARRPIMQEQLRYDSTNKASRMVQEIGGGAPASGNPSHRIWIIDSGIDSTHQDIQFELSEKDLSISFAKLDPNPFNDELGHGTFIAGIVGGEASTKPEYEFGYGINGVYPGAKMVSIKVFDADGNSNTSRIKSGLEHVLANGQPGDIVNLSLGYKVNPSACESGIVYQKILELAEKGIYVVMSAGNSSEESLMNFPGCIDLSTKPTSVKSKLFTIGSVEVLNSGSYLFSSFSNYGMPSLDYLEPGENIFTTAPGGMYVMVSGTSFSTAIFSGILYHQSPVGNITTIKRGAAPGDPDPSYPIGKIGN